MQVNNETIHAIQQAAIAAYPNEMCGIIVNDEFIQLDNVHPDKAEHFRINPVQLQQYPDYSAIVHSHPYDSSVRLTADIPDKRWLSFKDQQGWINSGKVWIVVATDGEHCSDLTIADENDIQPFEGREFIWGTQDCFTLARDYYKSIGIIICNHPREWLWWQKDQNMFVDGFKQEGFYQVALEDIRVNDALLFRVNSNIINHCGVIVGTDKLLHSVYNSVSRISKLSLYFKDIAMILRHKSIDNARTINDNTKI